MEFLTAEHRILIRLLNESDNPTVLAVAAHDLGQYVKHYERGKKYVPVTFPHPAPFIKSPLPYFIYASNNISHSYSSSLSPQDPHRVGSKDTGHGADDASQLRRQISSPHFRPTAREPSVGGGVTRCSRASTYDISCIYCTPSLSLKPQSFSV